MYLPSFLKFVVAVEPRKKNFQKFDRTLKLLQTDKIVVIDDNDYFNMESK